ncbi:MAG TPA: LLM class flavin-dependent oxidoreductase [Candidatus Limnocylindria bacterium]|nr:LLM class flavin-dependent oxidoreductase [Candidatus Limnocylindria bacterium]
MTRPLKVGIQLPEVERVVRWPELAEMARTAERIGLDSLWVGDHLLYRDRGPDPVAPWEAWSQLAALAAITTRVEIGPLVAATSFHNPAMIAAKANAVDEISGGRLILGLGAGWNETEYRAYGFPYDRRVSRFEEAFTIIRSLLRDGHADFDGTFYEVRDLPLRPPPYRSGGPPLVVGSIGPRMLEITLPHVDGWNAWHAWFGNSVEGYLGLRDRVDEACQRVGRDPASVERSLAILIGFSGAVGRPAGDESVLESTPIPGDDPDALAATLRAFADAGVGHIQLVLDPITVESIAALEPMLDTLDR